MRLLLACFFSFSLLCAEQSTATKPTATEDFETEFNAKPVNLFDPLSGYNEIMTSFNDNLYEYILRPTAEGYSYVVPEMARHGVSNFFDNLFFPIRLVNNLLQLKFQYSLEETERFVLNSTMGILGFRDVANEELGIRAHKEDFGQTLGFYGLGSGFHVVLPILGPSNIRDIVGLVGDYWLNPLNYIESRDANLLDNSEESLYVTSYFIINEISLHVKEYENIKKDAIELYPFLRSLYESRRNKLISE